MELKEAERLVPQVKASQEDQRVNLNLEEATRKEVMHKSKANLSLLMVKRDSHLKERHLSKGRRWVEKGLRKPRMIKNKSSHKEYSQLTFTLQVNKLTKSERRKASHTLKPWPELEKFGTLFQKRRKNPTLN